MKDIIANNTKAFRLFGKSGSMEEVKQVPVLPIGCKIYCYGFCMNESEGAVISEPNEFGQYKCVYISDFKSGFFTLEEYSRPRSQKFGIGNYYDDNFETVEDTVLEDYIIKAEIATNIEKNAEAKKAASDKKEIDELPSLYPHLTLNFQDDQNVTKKNLVADLKKNFPETKFSVKKSHYSTYYVSWTDGPSESKVEEVAGKFEGYETDITGDFRDPNTSNFNKVFGDFKYVFYSRSASKEIENCKDDLKALLLTFSDGYPNEADNIFYYTFRNTSIPIGAKIKSIQMKDNYSGRFIESFEFVYDTNDASLDFELFLVDYSDKAVAVFGNTKEVKEQLKEIGGKFNKNLIFNEVKQAGWIFSNKRKDSLEKAFNFEKKS